MISMARICIAARVLRVFAIISFLSCSLVACSAGGGGKDATFNSSSSAAAQPAASVTLVLTPQTIAVGANATLSWSSGNATACSASGSWAGAQAVNNSAGISTGNITVPGVYSFGITCSGPGGSGSSVQTLVVGQVPAPVVSVQLTPQSMRPGDAATISWSASNATACTAEGGTGSDGWAGAQPAANTQGLRIGPVATAGEYSYTLTCTGPGGTSAESRILTVSNTAPAAPPAVTFSASPTQIQPGQSLTLMWNASGANSCSASGGAGGDGWSGTQPTSSSAKSIGPITASGSYTYTLTCSGSGGSTSKTVTVVVGSAPPSASVQIVASPAQITAGSSAQLSWSTAHADTCTASGSWTGSKPLSASAVSTGTLATAGLYSYTLTCSGAGGSATDTANITVTAAPAPASVTSLSITPNTIQAGQSATLKWSSSDATSCTASGGSGSDGWNGSVATSSTGRVVGPINAAGNYQYTLICTGPNGTSNPVSATLTVGAGTPPAAIASFTATPTSIQTGQSINLAWSTSNATSCTASGGTGSDGWTGTVSTSNAGLAIGPINAAGTYSYTLNCTGPSGASGPQTVTVTVAAPAAASIASFTASPTSIQAGQSTTFAWSSNNATSCTASGGSGSDAWSGSVATSSGGTVIGPINTAGTYQYTLTCTGAGGSSTPATVSVTVGAPAPASIGSFTVNPTSIQTGQSTTLSWSTSNATSCTATGGTGTDGWSGSVATASSGISIGPINSPGTYQYTLTCSGAGGSSGPNSQTLTVVAPPPGPATINGFTVTPNNISSGQSASLSWSTSNATSCTATGGSGSDGWSGSVATASSGTSVGPIGSPGTYQYTLTCTGPGGTSSPASTTLVVGPGTPPAAVTALTATPASIQTGQSTSLSWSTSNASSCTASGGTGSDGWSGSVATSSSGTAIGPINVAGTYQYTLTCSGAGGSSGARSATVTVTAPPPPPVITSLAANPSSIQAGQSTSLTWTTSQATSCTASGGAGADGWSGSVPTSSAGQTVGPINTAGTYSYVLNCSGAGGTVSSTASVTVNAAPPGPPSVTFTANDQTSLQIQPGSSMTLKWSATNATSCTASGGTGSDNWSGAQATASAGTVIGPINTQGIYSYTLSCTGPGGSGSSSVMVTVVSASSVDCGIGPPSVALLTPNATASVSASNQICVFGICNTSVDNLSRVIDSSLNNYATVNVALGVAAVQSLRVTNASSYPSGRKVGFLVAQPNSLLDLGALQNITIRTLLNGVVQESATSANLLQVSAVGLFNDANEGFAGFTTTKSFDAVRIDVGSIASALTALRVYGACVSLQ